MANAQLLLPMNWTELWNHLPIGDYNAQAWIIAQQPELHCGYFVKHKATDQVGKIHTIYPPYIYAEIEWDEKGWCKKSARWFMWEVERVAQHG